MNIRNMPRIQLAINVDQIILQFLQGFPLCPIIRILLKPTDIHIIFLIVDKLLGFHAVNSQTECCEKNERIKISSIERQALPAKSNALDNILFSSKNQIIFKLNIKL